MAGLIATIGAEARALWGWWLTEIGELAPALARLAPAVPADRLRPQRDEEGRLCLVSGAPGSTMPAGAEPPPLELPEDIVLIRTLSLPRAARTNLAEIAASKIPWETPFEAEAVYFGSHAAPLSGGNEFDLTLAVTPKPLADAFLAEAKASGTAFGAVGVLAGTDGPWIELITPPAARARGLAARPQAVLLAVLIGAILFGPLISYQLQGAWLAARIEALAADAAAAAEARAELRRLDAGNIALSEAGTRFASRTSLLNRLSTLVPPPGWLFRLQLTDDGVELFGYADDPGVVVAALENAPDFDAVSFRSPTVRDETTGKQRFHIGARLTGRGP